MQSNAEHRDKMRRWYNRTKSLDMKGVRVRSLVPMSTSLGSMPAGTIFTVEGKRGGLFLKSDPCPSCGISFSIHGVSEEIVELVEE